MEQTGLSFLINLSGNPGAAEVPALPTEGSAPTAVNEFLKIHAAVATENETGGANPRLETKNSPAEGLIGRLDAAGISFDAAGISFDVAGISFDAITPEKPLETPAPELAPETPGAETKLVDRLLIRGLSVTEPRGYDNMRAGQLYSGTELHSGTELRGRDVEFAAPPNGATELASGNDEMGGQLDSVTEPLGRKIVLARKPDNAVEPHNREIGQIDRLDIASDFDGRRGLANPQETLGERVEKIQAPIIAGQDRQTPVRNDERGLASLFDKPNEAKIVGNGDRTGAIAINRQKLTADPVAQISVAPENITADSDLAEGADLFEPVLPREHKPVANENRPFDVAAFAGLEAARPRNTRRAAERFVTSNAAREISASSQIHQAMNVEAQKSGNAISAKPGELKLQALISDGKVLSDAESRDLFRDEASSAERRFAPGGDVGRFLSINSHATPTTISSLAAAPAAAEAFVAEQVPGAASIEPRAISAAEIVGERSPVQFISPNATVPAGAAWAQVINAISERTGEAKLELRLNPPELGRVTIGFETEGAELVRAVVSADSQQTLDLMRRNLDILQRELARSGLDNIDVELADRDSSSHAQDADERTVAYATSDDAPVNTENNIPLASFIADGRLDLRV